LSDRIILSNMVKKTARKLLLLRIGFQYHHEETMNIFIKKDMKN